MIGENMNETLLDKTVQQQDIIEQHLFKKIDSDFYDKYNYIEYKPLQFANRSASLMGFLNLYTLSSPLVSIITPLLVLLIPFFIMRVRGFAISFVNYFQFLKEVMSKLPAFRVFSFDPETSLNTRLTAIMAFIFYFIQLYYNTSYCAKYINKNHDIHNIIIVMRKVIEKSAIIHNTLESCLVKLSFEQSKNTLSAILKTHWDIIKQLTYKLSIFEEKYSVLSLSHVNTIGEKLKLYYEFVSDYKDINNQLRSVFDLNTFCYYYKNIYSNSQSGYINPCGLDTLSEKEPIVFKNTYFPMLLLEDTTSQPTIVYNSLSLKKSYILSGPNASGKTTLLKSILFNILCSQQFGYGFYDSCQLNECFSVIESYINISDTHDRNSLFQNEARRMLEIIKTTQGASKTQPMFFVFDELFSGTNPIEANACGVACLRELLNNKQVRFCLTTHYIDLCNYFSQKRYSRLVSNEHMECQKDINQLLYTYKMKKGISKTHGGVNVLEKIGFTKAIVDDAYKLLSIFE